MLRADTYFAGVSAGRVHLPAWTNPQSPEAAPFLAPAAR